MRKSIPAASLFCLFAVASLGAHAATNHTVTVGGGGLVFTPANLPPIAVGDTVTFTNAGGFHNVVADDGSFTCATDCTPSGGAPSSSAWSFTRTFNTPGSFGYHCAVHVGSGMVGTITVQAPTPVTLQSFEVE